MKLLEISVCRRLQTGCKRQTVFSSHGSICSIGGKLDLTGLNQLPDDVFDLRRPQTATDAHLDITNSDRAAPADYFK
jgi:hypothetical protein